VASRRRKRTTARQRVASRRNLVQARKKRNRRIAIGVGAVSVGALTTAGVVARHRLSGSSFSKTTHANVSSVTGKQLPSGTRFAVNRAGASLIRAKGATKTRLSYNHSPVTMKQVLGTTTTNRLLASQHFENPFAPKYRKESTRGYGSGGKRLPKETPIKTLGGKEIFPGYTFAKGKSVSLPSRDIRLSDDYKDKKFVPKRPRSVATVNGQPLDVYLRNLKRR
jgi:hypothetical protein